MYLYDDWRIVFTLRPVTTLGGRIVKMGHVERRVWMAHGEVKHKEYRMPLHREKRNAGVVTGGEGQR